MSNQVDGHEWQRRFILTLICWPLLFFIDAKEHLLRLVWDGLRRVYLIFTSFDGPNICAVLGSMTSCDSLTNAAERQNYRRHLHTGTTSTTVNPKMTYFTFDPVGGHFLHLFEVFKVLQFRALDTGGQQYRSCRSRWFLGLLETCFFGPRRPHLCPSATWCSWCRVI